MAFTSSFFDAELDVYEEYDRVYSAEDFAEYFGLFIGNGVFPTPATQMQVIASTTPDMNVNVSSGFCWINGYKGKNDGNYSLAIQAASGTQNRVDAVVVRWVKADRKLELAVKTGVAAGSPVAPTLERTSEVYELMLATVTLAAGTTAITQAMITDKRPDNTVCGFVTGVVQQIDTTNLFAQYDDAFQTWFDNLKEQLSDNVVTNLQNQIDALGTKKVNVSDKASLEDLSTGVLNKWVPSDFFKLRFITQIITESTTFQLPNYMGSIYVLVVGGGGNGGSGSSGSGSMGGGGGGGGYMKSAIIDLPPDVITVPITIGAAGQPTSFGTYLTANSGANGGSGGRQTTAGGNGGNGGAGGGGGGTGYMADYGNGGSGGSGGCGGGGGGGSAGGNTYVSNTAVNGGNGGNGGAGGGGGGGGRASKSSSTTGTNGSGGSGGNGNAFIGLNNVIIGPAGGAGGTIGAAGSNGVNTSQMDLELEFKDSGYGGGSGGGYGGGGGGGYGGNGGNGGAGGGGGGGGGIGANGGGGGTGGGGGGGYGGSGGVGGCGGGGGGGYGLTSAGSTSGASGPSDVGSIGYGGGGGTGYGGGGGGAGSGNYSSNRSLNGGKGGSGVCIIQYYSLT